MPLKDWFKDFRKTSQKNATSSTEEVGQPGQHFLLVNDTLEVVKEKRVLLPPNVDLNDADLSALSISSPVHRQSRLKPTLRHVFKDKEVLSCFIQFMDAQRAGHLVRFCLEAEAFASFYASLAGEGVGGAQLAEGDMARNGKGPGQLEAKQSDAVAIYHRFLAPESSSIIPVPDDLRNAAIKNICSDRDGSIPGDAFRPCWDFVLRTIEERYFPSFLQSEFFCRWQIDFLTNRRACLADFLYHESAMFYLREFMENEDLTELLVFVLSVDTYHTLVTDSNCTTAQAMEYAMDVYDKYFSLQATSPLGFDDSLRMEVECAICQDTGPDPESFERSRQIVLQYIERNFLSVYLNTQLFYKYLGELVYAVHTSDLACLPRMRPRRLASDSESLSALLSPGASSHAEISSVHSEPSAHSRNTLLAGASAQGRSLRRALDRLSGGELRIPEPLSGLNSTWSRGVRQALSSVGAGGEGRSTGGSSNGSMSFGHVDELGMFHSEIEQLPPDDGLLSSVFKKSKDRKQAEEDMALRIAQMVIHDVQELTATAQTSSQP